MPEPADDQKLANERTKHTGEMKEPKEPKEPKDVERPAAREQAGGADERGEDEEEAGRSGVEQV